MYELIQHQELSSTSSSITFTGIPSGWTDLIVKLSLRSESSGIYAFDDLGLRINGDSGNNYIARVLRSREASASTFGGSASNHILIFGATAAGATSSTFSSGEICIANYSSNTAKSVLHEGWTENNSTSMVQGGIVSGSWSGTAAVNSLTIFSVNGWNFVAGSSATLYGINRTSAVGKPKAIGGNITYANGYWVHTFTGSGTFTPLSNLQAEYVVVAGGGGGTGGGYFVGAAGGGGAGGYRSSVSGQLSGGGGPGEPRISLLAGANYSVIVGAGGTGGAAQATNGINSSFDSIISIGGGAGGLGQSTNGNTGGSGGGGGYQRAGGAGTANQGFAGAAGGAGGDPYPGGGGGGAGAAASGRTGGAGLFSSITGTYSALAGGGGGGEDFSGSIGGGGVGGGGNGGGMNSSGFAGTTNTGGGGGGGGGPQVQSGGAGGSGIVIIRYPA